MIGEAIPDLRSRQDLGARRPAAAILPEGRRPYPQDGSGCVKVPARRELPSAQANVTRACRGVVAAFSRLVETHSDLVHRVAVRLVGADDAQDASQETWIRVWRNLKSFRGESAFTTWLYKVATNSCLRMRRDRAQHREREYGDEGTILLAEPSGGEADPEVSVLDAERWKEVSAALDRVRADHRAALTLRHMDGLSYAEISEVLGVPVGTAKGWVSRGRDALLVGLDSGNGAWGMRMNRSGAGVGGREDR